MGIDHGAIDIGVAAASVGSRFHGSIFQNLFGLGAHQLLGTGPVSDLSGLVRFWRGPI
jgi:hypothetical protein